MSSFFLKADAFQVLKIFFLPVFSRLETLLPLSSKSLAYFPTLIHFSIFFFITFEHQEYVVGGRSSCELRMRFEKKPAVKLESRERSGAAYKTIFFGVGKKYPEEKMSHISVMSL